MTPSSTRIHLSNYCQILVVSSTPTTIGMMKHLASMVPPAEFQQENPAEHTPFKIILSGFDPHVIDLVKQARQANHPASLVIVDIQKCNDWDAEHLIGALLTADSSLQILLLSPAGTPLGTRMVTFLSRCNRMAVLRTPCDELELGQLVRVMLAKWLNERTTSPAAGEPVVDTSASTPASVVPSMLPPSGASSIIPPRPSTILAVEDDETVLWMMGRVLETHNYRVLSATNADDGWRKWRENINTIKLVITDINMPGGPNGVALGHAIQDEDGSVPVIYTSGNRAVQEFTELQAGTNYLVKPFRMDDLLDIVSRALIAHEGRGISPPSRLVSWSKNSMSPSPMLAAT